MPFVPFVDQLPDACRDYSAIDGSASYETSEGHWLWVSRDAPLIAFGASPTPAFRSSLPEDVNRFQVMLFNNFWYTNFVGDSHGVMEFQFDLAWSPRSAVSSGHSLCPGVETDRRDQPGHARGSDHESAPLPALR